MHVDMGLRNGECWLPNGGALPLRVGSVRRAAVRLSDGCLALMCPRRCLAHLALCALRCLAWEQLQRSFKLQLQWRLGPARVAGKWEVPRPFAGGGGSKGTGVVGVSVSTAGECCVLAEPSSVLLPLLVCKILLPPPVLSHSNSVSLLLPMPPL